MKSLLKQILLGSIEYPDTYVAFDYFLKYLQPDYHNIIVALDRLKIDKLYTNRIHGLYHSEKVLFFAYIIGKLEELDATDMQIIIDAALYHDMGRSSDYVDDLHGYAGALKIVTVLDNEVYNDPENIKIIKAIIDAHSLDDFRQQFIFESYEIRDYDRFNHLCAILKDADALDRARFNEGIASYLDETFLRLASSKKLIAVAKQINEIYKQIMNKLTAPITTVLKSYGVSECYHSIGFDFFKFSSILRTGILSKKEMLSRNIRGTINFIGGNLNDWISVISLKHINKLSINSGYANFTRHGIGFYCRVDNMYEGLSVEQKYNAIEKELPYDHSGYTDEKFVYRQIPISQIVKIYIPSQYINMDIREIRYIYDSLSIDVVRERIKYFLSNVQKNGISTENIMDVIDIYLQKYLEIIQQLAYIIDQPNNSQNINLRCQIKAIDFNINLILQKLIHNSYCKEMKRENTDIITVLEVICWELKKIGYDFDICYDKDGAYLDLNHQKEVNQGMKIS